MPRESLRRMAVAGGTHGNEMSGVYLVWHWLLGPAELQRPSFSAAPVLANPAATSACRCYVDRDLNRTFTSTCLNAEPRGPCTGAGTATTSEGQALSCSEWLLRALAPPLLNHGKLTETVGWASPIPVSRSSRPTRDDPYEVTRA
ncbi:hypothetical protein P7K49_021377 [Saguinus oedipus]|uniref:Succinylglutamate desuccinylase/Aspartoacylase catalytic domain-containing protein n=1 Tax=Saguinus oedipus TaxID=9490 RepID=A0ABQ9UTA0_SAGOE|nr:hypothetical protein P7K49_021377 [Saguinus oedipus]